ncbi:hypothetical protein THII_0369 [Thioploca ingrica]|uniref:DUF3782 domain-containing protein n=1 Tax=Thioploca ingrica TaxID=40754 RepID=A0A090BU85_9GAMM|nr:hypothetical protein THII_0369 [Thioploca ingrica]
MTLPSFDINQLDQLILQRLPALVRQNKQIQELVLELARENFAERQETEDRFYQLLNELKRDREEQTRKWDEQNRKWDEQNRKWEEFKEYTQEQNRKWEEYIQEQNRKWEEFKEYTQEQNRKWDEQNRKWDEQNHKWNEQNHKWEEYAQAQNRKWNEAQQEFQRMHEDIMAIAQKQDRSFGALGARWGIQSENTFRNALAAILEKSFQVKVINVNEYDDEGTVFGRPDQVELDVIIKNGLLIICEIKSSVSKSDMYIFERKVRFYEKRHQRQVNRMLVISPMIDVRAQPVAQQLGIEVYTDSLEVKSLS